MRMAMMLSAAGAYARVIDDNRDWIAPVKPALVITDRDCPAYRYFAEQTDVPTICLPFETYSSREAFEAACLAELRYHEIDFLFLNFNRLLGPTLLEAYPGRIFNLHSALLPLYKGFGAIKGAFESDMLYVGATIHQVSPAMDDGPVLAQALVGKIPGESYDDFYARYLRETAPMAVSFLRELGKDWPEYRDGRWTLPSARYGSALINPMPDFDPARLDLSALEERLQKPVLVS
jgi:phosphoribosylglycinamide formyltransferase-1